MSPTIDKQIDNGFPWINPIGGFGDMLMLSGVLKQVVDRNPAKQFNLIRRTNYLSILKGHPAIAAVGFPHKDAALHRVDYWSMEKLGPGLQRPYQVLAREFGLPTPVEELLYLPNEVQADPLLDNFLPWKKKNVMIAPASDSPRKTMHPSNWHRVVDRLLADDIFVIQVGRLRETRIRNAFSILGLTTPRQLISLLKKCDLVITMDNFIMHAAHLTGTPTVALWGPTRHEVYGYPEQLHIQADRICVPNGADDCIGPSKSEGGKLYGTPCPQGERHCLDQIKPELIYVKAKRALPGMS